MKQARLKVKQDLSIFNENSFIKVHRVLASNFGMENGAFLSELIAKNEYFQSTNREEKYIDEDGNFWFYYTLEKFSELGIKKAKVQSATRLFTKLGFIKTKNMGSLNRKHFCVNSESIKKFLFEDKKDSLPKSANQFDENGKPVYRNQQTSLTKSENQFTEISKHILDRELNQIIDKRECANIEDFDLVEGKTSEQKTPPPPAQDLEIENLYGTINYNCLDDDPTELQAQPTQPNPTQPIDEAKKAYLESIQNLGLNYPINGQVHPDKCIEYIKKITDVFKTSRGYRPDAMSLLKDKQKLMEYGQPLLDSGKSTLEERVTNPEILSLEQIGERILKLIKIQEILSSEKANSNVKYNSQYYDYWLGGHMKPTLQTVLNANNYTSIEEVYNRLKGK